MDLKNMFGHIPVTAQQSEALHTVKTLIDSKKAPSSSYSPADGCDRIRMVSTKEGPGGNQQFRLRRPDGTIGIERRPSRAHPYSNGIDPSAPLDTDSEWAELTCDHHGHMFDQAMTSSSARVMTKGRFIKDETHQAALIKRRYFGWFPINRCLVSVLRDDEILPKHIRVKSILEKRFAPKDRDAELTERAAAAVAKALAGMDRPSKRSSKRES